VTDDDSATAPVAVVTGAGRNIGRQIAIQLAGSGHSVVVNVRSNAAEASEVVRTIRDTGGKAMSFVADVTDPAAVQAMVDATLEAYGRIDVLVNNAALRRWTSFLDLDASEWHEVHAVNLHAVFYCCKMVVPSMVKQRSGCILNISGEAAYVPIAQAHTSSSKAGAIGLTKSMALELGPHGIRVNAVVPALVDTTREQAMDPQFFRRELAQTPVGRMAAVEDIADVCDFLVSSRARHITGQSIHVNGGRFMY
jgi:3-oxoacyl-[acyl-carrier protein] reductase